MGTVRTSQKSVNQLQKGACKQLQHQGGERWQNLGITNIAGQEQVLHLTQLRKASKKSTASAYVTMHKCSCQPPQQDPSKCTLDEPKMMLWPQGSAQACGADLDGILSDTPGGLRNSEEHDKCHADGGDGHDYEGPAPANLGRCKKAHDAQFLKLLPLTCIDMAVHSLSRQLRGLNRHQGAAEGIWGVVQCSSRQAPDVWDLFALGCSPGHACVLLLWILQALTGLVATSGFNISKQAEVLTREASNALPQGQSHARGDLVASSNVGTVLLPKQVANQREDQWQGSPKRDACQKTDQ